jgi:aldose 1-epimerase
MILNQTAAALAAVAAFSTLAMASSAPVPEPFGRTADGTPVEVYTLTNNRGVKLRAMTYGAIVLSLDVPDKKGAVADITLGYKTLAEYEKATPYFGAIVGRFGNRIAGGQFSLDGNTHKLAKNNTPGGKPCSLHGGNKGFDKVVWKAEGLKGDGSQGVRFRYLSKDGEEGYPGNLQVSVTYWLNENSEWRVEYEATTDKATPVNLTQHAYFNLKGEGCGDILGHTLQIAASKFTPVNEGMIPTGELRSVEGTALDFRKARAIGDRVNSKEEQMALGGGYDHNFVLDNQGGSLASAALVFEPTSGRTLEVSTTEPGIQFYCGNFLDGTLSGKSGNKYEHRNGFCLESQHYPDSPNHPEFPSSILRPGKTLKSTTVFKFGVK